MGVLVGFSGLSRVWIILSLLLCLLLIHLFILSLLLLLLFFFMEYVLLSSHVTPYDPAPWMSPMVTRRMSFLTALLDQAMYIPSNERARKPITNQQKKKKQTQLEIMRSASQHVTWRQSVRLVALIAGTWLLFEGHRCLWSALRVAPEGTEHCFVGFIQCLWVFGAVKAGVLVSAVLVGTCWLRIMVP